MHMVIYQIDCKMIVIWWMMKNHFVHLMNHKEADFISLSNFFRFLCGGCCCCFSEHAGASLKLVCGVQLADLMVSAYSTW